MATANSTVIPQHQPELPSVTENPELSRFDQMRIRMKGTVTILGDIVNSDPELWDSEGE